MNTRYILVVQWLVDFYDVPEKTFTKMTREKLSSTYNTAVAQYNSNGPVSIGAGVGGGVQGTLNDIAGAADGPVNAASDAINAAEAFYNLVTSAQFWERVGEVAVGGILLAAAARAALK